MHCFHYHVKDVNSVTACQANYIRDVQGGTVSPSSSAELTGLATQ
ncbi:colicin release lysis protein [Shigella sonnei]|nr:colicin release lysis protein [Shigella sonnei]